MRTFGVQWQSLFDGCDMCKLARNWVYLRLSARQPWAFLWRRYIFKIPSNVDDAIKLQYQITSRINLLSLRYYPSTASLLGSRPWFRVVHCLRRVDFDKRHNGAEVATYPTYIRPNLPDSLHRTKRFASRCLGPSLNNVRARLYYAHVGFRLRWVINSKCKIQSPTIYTLYTYNDLNYNCKLVIIWYLDNLYNMDIHMDNFSFWYKVKLHLCAENWNRLQLIEFGDSSIIIAWTIPLYKKTYPIRFNNVIL